MNSEERFGLPDQVSLSTRDHGRNRLTSARSEAQFALENSMYCSSLFKVWMVPLTAVMFGSITFGALRGYPV